MDERFERCMREGRLVKGAIEPDMILKELEAAEADLDTAGKTLAEGNPKWATVQAYYCMFHSAKAMALSKGYREKSHICLSVALNALFVDPGIIESKHSDRFKDCMDLRQEADYGLVYSESSAKATVAWAKEFLEEAKRAIKL